ncbi:MAG: lipoprotein-releasing ABC transporter permease subunit [Thermodesulfobacteriota bacterium]
MMPYELFIALRYLKAKRKQSFISVISLISILGVMVGVAALIIVLSVMTGFELELREKILGVNAHMVITESGGAMAGYNTVVDEVEKVAGVAGVTPFIYGQAMISSDGGAVGVVVRGIDLDSVGDVMILPEKIHEGGLAGLDVPLGRAGEGALPGIVVGKELARKQRLSVGDDLTVISPMGRATAVGNIPRMASFEVSGIFELGMYDYDSSLAFISIRNAQRFFRLGKSVTGVEVSIDDIDHTREIATNVQVAVSALGNYWVRTWMDMNRNLFSALKLEKVAMFIILALIVLVAAFNIISTLIMVVMEKSKDIAILKSMGATAGGIMRIFMIEGLVIGLTGTFLGAILGLATALNLERVVQFIEHLFNFTILPPSVYYIDKLPSRVEPGVVVTVVLLSICISFIATLYPSWQASRLEPVDAIRYE